MGSLLGVLLEGIAESSPKAQKVLDKLVEVTGNQQDLVERKYTQYQKEAEYMSTDRLKEKYKSLDSEKDTFKKNAYANVLKERL